MGRLLDAQKNLEYILTIHPDDKLTLLLAGMVAENLKNYSAAVRWLSKVPELIDQCPEAQLALGRSYYKLGQQEDIRRTLGKISGRVADGKFVFWAGQEAFLAQDLRHRWGFVSFYPAFVYGQSFARSRHRNEPMHTVTGVNL